MVSPGYATQARPITSQVGGATEDLVLVADVLACNAPGDVSQRVYFADFEQDDGGFTIRGANPSWHLRIPTSGFEPECPPKILASAPSLLAATRCGRWAAEIPTPRPLTVYSNLSPFLPWESGDGIFIPFWRQCGRIGHEKDEG